MLKSASFAGNPDAKFVWSFLILNSYDTQLINSDAVRMLSENAEINHIPSIVELGTILYRGNSVKQDRERALGLWKKGEELGNNESGIRRILHAILNLEFESDDYIRIIPYLNNAVSNNSVLATVALGLCFERGLGMEINFAKASDNYRLAAIRGSIAGYESLKRIYDSVRP
jgi:TPR repeat protein